MPTTFSTTWPPSGSDPLGLIRLALADAMPLETTWPPRSQTQSSLAGLASDDVHARLLRMQFDANAGQAFGSRTKSSTASSPDERSVEAAALVTVSSAAIGHLISADFWKRLSLVVDASAPWRPGSPVPEFSVMIDDPAGQLLRYTQQPIAYADLVNAVKATTVTLPKLEEILIQAPAPELCLLRKFQDIQDAKFDTTEPPYPWTCWVVDATIDVLASVAHRLKHAIRLPRPLDADFDSTGRAPGRPLIDPAPAYAAYPGGHSSLMAALTIILSKVCACNDSERTQLRDYARLISDNREAAGLHTKLDTNAGWDLGLALGEAMVAAATRQHTVNGSPSYTYLPWAAAFQSAEGEWK